MGLFGRNYNKPGPGVPKDMPRKKGMARFFELLLRDFSDLVKLSLLFSLAILPSAAVFLFASLPFMLGAFELNLVFILLSLLLAYPIGGASVACYFNISRLMRDDASYVWHDFKRKFKENHKQAAMTGIICTAFIYMQILLWFQIYYQIVYGAGTDGILWFLLAIISFLLFSMITPYVFLHYAYINLNTLRVLKNSSLMAFAYLPRSFMGALSGNIAWILIALFIPNSLIILPVIPFILFSLSMLLSLSWVWPKFDAFFNIEETIKNRRNEENALERASEENVFSDD